MREPSMECEESDKLNTCSNPTTALQSTTSVAATGSMDLICGVKDQLTGNQVLCLKDSGKPTNTIKTNKNDISSDQSRESISKGAMMHVVSNDNAFKHDNFYCSNDENASASVMQVPMSASAAVLNEETLGSVTSGSSTSGSWINSSNVDAGDAVVDFKMCVDENNVQIVNTTVNGLCETSDTTANVCADESSVLIKTGSTSAVSEIRDLNNEQSADTDMSGEEISGHAGSNNLTDVDNHDHYEIRYDFSTPVQVGWSSVDIQESSENFFKGCKWSPDGTCLLTNSEDKTLRVFELPAQLYSGATCENNQMTPVLQMREGELIYDYAWYPLMSSSQPDTCCLACSSRDAPVHLWDAFSATIRCSYLSYSQMDELVSPHSLCFSLCGSKLYCGFNKVIRVFDLASPGRRCEERKTYKKTGQSGIISCMTMSPDQHSYAAGSYSKTVGIYDERTTNLMFLLQGQIGGVTHLMYSADGAKLYSGGRKDPEILCWDLRNPGKVLYVLERNVVTNQRMYFDLSRNSQYIVSGSHDGLVNLWDSCCEPSTTDGDSVLTPAHRFRAHTDCVNGASFHPYFPILATASGQRQFKTSVESDESDSEDSSLPESSVKLWWCGQSAS